MENVYITIAGLIAIGVVFYALRRAKRHCRSQCSQRKRDRPAQERKFHKDTIPARKLLWNRHAPVEEFLSTNG